MFMSEECVVLGTGDKGRRPICCSIRVICWSFSSSAVMQSRTSAMSCCKAFSKDKISQASCWDKEGGLLCAMERGGVRNAEENETERSRFSLDLERLR
ncbi:hypothetical protein RCL_jg14163.t1 [Rhizophagus clarus]|uniref:Uncharacterized protein n=1 Tax=Rhizophagus clarus TaxID=94130 RepID=A0A8H3LYL8_9GLOM|nr:hypothetical protein RCL_jg14163.t1 [Rhizophagus clarus]